MTLLRAEPAAPSDVQKPPAISPPRLEDLKRSAPRPADFEAFWNAQLRELTKTPMTPVLVPGKGGRAGVVHSMVEMDLPHGGKLRGQLAVPDKPGKFPAMVIFQYAGVYGLSPGIVTTRAADGWLVLNVCAHDLPLDESPEFYQKQGRGPLRNYAMIGNTDRETSYFLRMFLACSRAVDFLASRPDWDGRTLVATGTSQGGLQSIVAAALNPKVTAVVVLVPAGCDTTAPLGGRAMSWPYWLKEATDGNRDAIIRTSSYFDALNFAPKVRCPALVGFGLLDKTATPEGVSQLVGLLGGPVETVVMPAADHKGSGGTHEPFTNRSKVWFESLKTKHLPPIDNSSR